MCMYACVHTDMHTHTQINNCNFRTEKNLFETVPMEREVSIRRGGGGSFRWKELTAGIVHRKEPMEAVFVGVSILILPFGAYS